MKLHAEADIVNRRLASHGMKGNNKKVKSHIAIGKKPVAEGKPEMFIMVTNATHRQGVKYLIAGNIEQVFVRLVNEGKTTIRFKEPEHDLCIKGDPVEVKSFLSVLKKVMKGEECDKISMSTLQPISNKQLSGPKRKLTVSKRSEYPVKEGFPQSLNSVKINGIRLAKIDSRILKLVNLKELDMSDNEIESLPEQCDNLTCLVTLNLINNRISTIPRGFCVSPLSRSLTTLDLTSNKIKLLPNAICQMAELTLLHLDRNELTQLPPSLGNLSKLKVFTASYNKIKFLPGSVAALRLDKLDISDNPIDESEPRVISNKLTGVSSLLEISAKVVVKQKITYTPEDMFPQLFRYMESVMYCPCSEPVWNNVARAMVKLQLSRISRSVSCNFLKEVNMDASLCSTKCLNTFISNPFAF
eukprot:TRINITY_DN2953_c0_g1_i13.p1 TRINITY_DN2953_c0_g1~~TRINITY_DN2953_c0_g1_i13.p1  ORF type:complete len:414 (+),score=81.12 TRINITY_DN2953_c0_g1_i13:83-1324(+)